MKRINIFLFIILIISASVQAQEVEALGIPIKSPNLLWNLHPSNDPVNNRILPFFTKKLNGDIVSILIDLKSVNENGAPLGRFSLVRVNTTAGNYKMLDFQPQANAGTPSTYGSLWTKFEGADKKIYFCTVESGGELLQYDVEKDTAIDLGAPFAMNNKVFGIYSMAIGSDSAIYGGSFSNGNGDTYAFRYDPKTNTYWKYLVPIDNNLQYVSYVGGDAECTYVICGQSVWNVYAIKRRTNTVTKLLSSANRIYGIQNTACGCYITADGLQYKLSATAALQSSAPANCNALNFTLTYADPTLPKTYWNELTKTYYYQRPNDVEKSFFLDIPAQEKKIKFLTNFNDSIITGNGGSYSYAITYNPSSASAPKTAGNNSYVSLYSMLSYNNKIYMGGYPSGELLQWDPGKSWTYGTQTLSYTPPAITSSLSNPVLEANFRPANFGIHQLYIAGVTNNGYMVVAGNNLRTDTSISFGSYKDGVTKQLIDADRFKDYSVKGFTLSSSKQTAYVLAQKRDSWQHWVYEYDPEKNNVIDSFSLLSSPVADISSIMSLPNDELFGKYRDLSGKESLFTFSLLSRQITWQQTFITSTPLYYKLGPDNQVWFCSTPISPRVTVFKKFNPYTKKISDGPSVTNPDYVSCNVTDLAFFKRDIYLAGYLNLIRIKNVVDPVPVNLSPEQQIEYLLNTYKKVDMSCK